jgi:hypothetical protein
MGKGEFAVERESGWVKGRSQPYKLDTDCDFCRIGRASLMVYSKASGP